MRFLSALFTVCLFASLAGAATQDNKELARLLEEEQADHSHPAGKAVEASVIAERHRARVMRVREICAKKELQTAADYSRAALMLQRGEGPEDYRLARELEAIAISKDKSLQPLKWGPEQDCAGAIPVCKSTYVEAQSYTGAGTVQEGGPTTCPYWETNSVWYVFTAQTSGSFIFTINTPNDYNFALYNITNGGCADVPGSTAIRCNYSGIPGSTGLNLPAQPETPTLIGSGPVMPGVNVTTGQTYALLVSNFTGDQNGYTLTFGGTASIGAGAPSLVSATMDANACEIEITTSKPILCSTIAPDGSDFQLLSSGGATLTGASGVGCGSSTTKIRLSYSLTKNVCNTWAVRLTTGTDGNTLLDSCQHAAVPGVVLPIQNPPPAVPHLALSSNVFCDGAAIIADGTASTGEVRHFWSVQESDANWNVYGKECSGWFPGPAGTLDVRQFAAQNGCPLECGKFYRIKLAVQNCCTNWNETVQLIRIACPPRADAGPDKTVCCSGPQKVQIGSPAVTGLTYSWSPTTGLDNPASSNPTIDFSTFNGTSVAFPSVYEVTVTDASGCTAKDTVYIETVCACRPPAKVKVERVGVCSPNYRLTADCACGDTAATYLWSPGGQTTSSIEVPGGTESYTVTCRNACGATVSQPVVLPVVTVLQGSFPSIQCPNVFTPNGDNVNDFWSVLDLSHPAGFIPAYNATDYELVVYDRWGSQIVVLSGSTTTGFANGSIPHWDGITNQSVFYSWWQHLFGRHDTYAGSPVSDGTYYYIFRMKNCTNGWTDICYGFISVFR